MFTIKLGLASCCNRKTLLLLTVIILVVGYVDAYPRSATIIRDLYVRSAFGHLAFETKIYGSRMPKFTAEEQDELKRILAGEHMVDFSDNIHIRKRAQRAAAASVEPESYNPALKTSSSTSSLDTINQESQSTSTQNSSHFKQRRGSGSPLTPGKGKLPSPPTSSRRIIRSQQPASLQQRVEQELEHYARQGPQYGDIEIGYDDFDQAMRELDYQSVTALTDSTSSSGGGGDVPIAKHSDVPKEHFGLSSGERIPEKAWTVLQDAQGVQASLSTICSVMATSAMATNVKSTGSGTSAGTGTGPGAIVSTSNNLLVFFADPRRMTSEFRLVLEQLEMLPRSQLRTALVMVNCDAPNDHRKFKKKQKLVSTVVLSDSSRDRVFMRAVKCQDGGARGRSSCSSSSSGGVERMRLLSALGILEISTGKVLKIWYEGDWDPSTTRDLIEEEVLAYRANPQRYMQSQIGIR